MPKTNAKRNHLIITQIKHICSNANYKIRYKNLKKKYEELEEENEKLTTMLSKEFVNMQLNQAKQEAIMYKRQRDQLRKDYIDLQNSTTNKES